MDLVRILIVGTSAAALAGAGCGSDLLGGGLSFYGGDSFVLRGTCAVVDVDGPVPIWVGENGRTYHLFQGADVSSEDFDRVTVPGALSRLVIAPRDDLEVAWQTGTIVEVRRVLEIID